MQGDSDVIELLNEVLTAELTAINQYFLDGKMLDHWGFEGLGHHFRDESIDEMRDAESLTDRILYLDGHPNLQRLSSLRIGETPLEKLELAATLEREAIARLNGGIELTMARHDHGSRELLEEILEGEEKHLDWLESQLEAVRQIGIAEYLSQQLHHRS